MRCVGDLKIAVLAAMILLVKLMPVTGKDRISQFEPLFRNAPGIERHVLAG